MDFASASGLDIPVGQTTKLSLWLSNVNAAANNRFQLSAGLAASQVPLLWVKTMRKILTCTFLILVILILNQSFTSIALTKSELGSDGACDDAPLLCPVHKEKMISGSVLVRFGRVAMYEFDESEEPERSKMVGEYLSAKKEQFPETHRWANGGCSPSFWEGKTSVMLHHCETCRGLEDQWFAKHPDFLKEDRLP